MIINGTTAHFTLYPKTKANPPKVSNIINIQAQNIGNGNPIPVNIPLTPLGFINFPIPVIKNKIPNPNLKTVGAYSSLLI